MTNKKCAVTFQGEERILESVASSTYILVGMIITGLVVTIDALFSRKFFWEIVSALSSSMSHYLLIHTARSYNQHP